MDEGGQVEMSDEGLMSHEIEECLAVVIKALRKCDPPPTEITAWGSKMLNKDRVGFIGTDALQSLRARFTSCVGHSRPPLGNLAPRARPCRDVFHACRKDAKQQLKRWELLNGRPSRASRLNQAYVDREKYPIAVWQSTFWTMSRCPGRLNGVSR